MRITSYPMPEIIDKKCARCKKELPKKRKKYCSNYCANVTFFERRWNGLRFLAWARDNGKCVQCKKPLSIKALYQDWLLESKKPITKQERLDDWILEWLQNLGFSTDISWHYTGYVWTGKKFHGPFLELAEIDHIVAICNGGESMSLDNLQTLCHACHAKKTSLDLRLRNKKRKAEELKNMSLDNWI